MSIVPTVQDLLNKRSNYWDSRGAYDSTENYLNSQFLSIREGFTKRLSEAVDKHLNLKHSNQQSSTRIYKNVKIECFEVNDDCFGIKLFFEDNESRQYLKPSLLGKLVILTRDNFKTIHLATVIHCHPTYLRKGYVFVEPFSRADLKSDAYGLRYTLLETTKHFESYYETLSALKGMKDSNFPMTQYIIQCCVCTALPRYLQSAALLKFQNNYILPEGLDKLQQITKDQQLDESQLDALKHAVTREFAVIEGPPGTGKTLLASKIVHILLDNEKSWSKHGPIVIICATDPALDQILESILPHTTSVIRVGSQTDNEVLKPYSLMAKREQMSKRENNCCASLYKKKYEIEEILRCIQKLTLYAKFFTASNDAVFQTCMMDLSLNKYKSSQEFSKWLTEKCFNSLFEDFNCNSTEENGNPCVQLLKNFEKDKCMLTDNDLPIDYIKRDEKDFGLHINPITLKDLEGLNQNCSIFQQKLFNNTILSDPRLPTDHATKKDYWESIKACHDTLIKSLFELEKKYHQEKYQLENLKRLANLEIFKEQKVIGITAGCIAMMKYSLNSLQAPIVLVDEAEKVRETHIVCSMTKECQHLILIGDKTMPRLLPTLFERMVNVKENCVTLKYQHRMRPEITKVMSLYTDKVFQNHASALNYPRLRGVESNLFFLSHNHPQTKDGINRHEIEFLIALAQYFLRLGYKESDITILSTCCRQANAFQAEMLSEETLKEVQVSTVFDYLGKENKIVLLSLVNNNDCKVEQSKF
ncbi:NFX1-type zinc finger-containing protein 1-like [Copidosoma floridanum]|uniref:NFX1-type zinc finger-containing protein 1-like n=1 Tax=Copidosoma floridanum TaxID=29053 RepID=UPI0006C96492|nr:NFX1-type zinc finger-containing protein 1-like [Copidosoma floridanum]